MDKTVAVKVLRPALAADEKIVARFSREARAASRISHPNALSVTDFGEDEGGIVFLVMEYLDGRTLKQVIREDGPLTLARTVEILRQVGDALNVAHSQNVVHRDLKSDNIMLLKTAVGDHAKVLDFGIAKINEPEGDFDTELTAPNLVIGTPQYMSPEQCSQGSEIDARSDIYSFGVILFEMLAGHVPFSGESPTMVMMKHLQDPVPSILEERPDLPPAIGRVLARAMAKLPANRYQTINELLEDLTIAAGMSVLKLDTPVVSRPTTVIDDDEVTVVRPSAEMPTPQPPAIPRRAPVQVPIVPAPQPVKSGFNPYKILIPSAAALLVAFAVIYAFTRESTPPANSNVNQQSTLQPDPNSQPVQPKPPPTGKGEEGIPAGGTIAPSTNVNANANANPAVSPTPLVEITPVTNANANENVNANANANSNKKAPSLPEPTKTITPDVPAPAPPGTKPAEPKPSPSVAASPGQI